MNVKIKYEGPDREIYKFGIFEDGKTYELSEEKANVLLKDKGFKKIEKKVKMEKLK